MRNFDYGNARLRAMKSRLLTQQELHTLAEAGSLRGLIAALTNTPYRKPVEAALSRFSGLECINSALGNDLINTLGRIRDFYREEALEMVLIVLRKYDLHNLQAILRGLSQNVSPAEIQTALLPVGELGHELLAELARAADPRAAIDLLASINSPYAQPYLKLRAEQPGADIPHMELALQQWSFSQVKHYTKNKNHSANLLSRAVDLEADLANLQTILRFAQTPEERKLLREWLGEEDLAPLLIGPGALPYDLLAAAGSQNTLDAAVEIFAGTVYSEALRTGLEAYAQSHRLSDLERQLRLFRLRWMSEKIMSDPLGIGVVLGYSALKVNEIGNLRWISNGINQGLSAQAIWDNLEVIG